MAAGRRGHIALAALCLLALSLLAGCGSAPRSAGPLPDKPPSATADPSRDGPPADPPPDLAQRPDPEPRVEPIRRGGPNKPYEVLGQRYTPLAADTAVAEKGLASWYGRKFHGRPTASGELYDMYASSAAHRTMPIPSYALVRNPANGREIVVRVNDRGPFVADRVIDLSYTAALKLGVLRGVAPVEVRRLTHDDIRSARWRGETAVALATSSPPSEAAASGVALAPPGTTTTEPPAPVPTPASTSMPAPAPAGPAPANAVVPLPILPVLPAATQAAPGFWVQLGAFSQRQGAFDLRQWLMRELAWLEPWLTVFDDRALFKVQAGPFASRSEAQGAAERIRGTTDVQPLVLQRR